MSESNAGHPDRSLITTGGAERQRHKTSQIPSSAVEIQYIVEIETVFSVCLALDLNTNVGLKCGSDLHVVGHLGSMHLWSITVHTHKEKCNLFVK